MNIDNVIQELEIIGGRLAPILDDQGKRAVDVALALMQNQRTDAKKKKKSKKAIDQYAWRLVIPPDAPLSFKDTDPSDHLKHQLHLDVSCQLAKPMIGRPNTEHNIAVRVWTKEESLWYRQNYDSETLAKKIRAGTGRRVMLRFHFDLANPGQPGPLFHLQIGGVQHSEEECCWHPETLTIPRFVHHPLNLLMACEFIARTFYATQYEQIARDASWKGALAAAQLSYLAPFFMKSSAFRGLTLANLLTQQSYLSSVWNR
jgi:hypothetical protein